MVSVSYSLSKKCPECGLGFMTHSTAVIVRCPDCGVEFELDEAESASVLGRGIE